MGSFSEKFQICLPKIPDAVTHYMRRLLNLQTLCLLFEGVFFQKKIDFRQINLVPFHYFKSVDDNPWQMVDNVSYFSHIFFLKMPHSVFDTLAKT